MSKTKSTTTVGGIAFTLGMLSNGHTFEYLRHRISNTLGYTDGILDRLCNAFGCIKVEPRIGRWEEVNAFRALVRNAMEGRKTEPTTVKQIAWKVVAMDAVQQVYGCSEEMQAEKLAALMELLPENYEETLQAYAEDAPDSTLSQKLLVYIMEMTDEQVTERMHT